MAKFTRIQNTVEAVKITQEIKLIADGVEKHGQPGDWFVTTEDGKTNIWPDSAFRKNFKATTKEAKELVV